MGHRDPYVAAVKGNILRQIEDVDIVDISHEVTPFDTNQAAYMIRHCWRSFPKGTVHVIGVNAEQTVEHPHRVVKMDGQYFVGADNGVFALIFDRNPDAVFDLNLPQESDVLTFPVRDLFVKAACHLARGGTPSVIGKEAPGLRPADQIRPVIQGEVIRGSITHADRYGNLITNIDRALFREIGKDRQFTIMLKRSKHDIRQLHDSYGEVPEGEKVALFNAAGLLEIAINKGAPGNGGGASSLFGLKRGDLIQVEFSAT